MGIYVKNMRLPKSCYDCMFNNLSKKYCEACDKEIILIRGQRRPDFCPLVEVKEPHGRLVDADNGIDEDVKDYEFNGKYVGCTIQDMLDSAPTVIEAEEQEHE